MIKKESVTYSAFYERFSVLEDDRIREILRNQKDYQEAARNAVVQIAVERGIIHSEDDLLSSEFQNSRNMRRSILPYISDEYHRNRLSGSIFRFLSVFSFLPVVYGVLQYAKGDLISSLLGVISGVIWFLVVLLMKRTRKSTLIFPLLGIIILAAVFIGSKLLKANPVRFLDFFVLLIGILLPAYFLFYIKKLIDFR